MTIGPEAFGRILGAADETTSSVKAIYLESKKNTRLVDYATPTLNETTNDKPVLRCKRAFVSFSPSSCCAAPKLQQIGQIHVEAPKELIAPC
jgi:hypothetical protein